MKTRKTTTKQSKSAASVLDEMRKKVAEYTARQRLTPEPFVPVSYTTLEFLMLPTAIYLVGGNWALQYSIHNETLTVVMDNGSVHRHTVTPAEWQSIQESLTDGV